MRRLAFAAPFAIVWAMTGFAPATAASAPLHVQDRAYMTYTLEQDLAQVAFSEMADRKAADPEVKRFAMLTAQYHRGSIERLQAAARRLEVEPPAALNPVAARTGSMLETLSGPAFDRAYLTSMIIAGYNGMYGARREMDHGFDPGLRAEGARQAKELLDNRRAAERLANRLSRASTADGLGGEDRNFLLYAMHIDLAQRGFAEVAAERASDPRVQTLARKLVEYHSRSYDRLARLAADKGVEPLREVSAISTGTRDRLRAMPEGATFDWAWLNAHAFTSYGAHYRYEREAIHGDDPQVKAVAAEEARTARRQHWQALRIMNDWTWRSR